MPRQDINGNDFEYYPVFPDNQTVKNIEFAAGKTFFGKKEFPNCYLTDVKIPDVEHFMTYPQDYETRDCHFLDQQCDYNNVETLGRSFDNVLFCNPLGIGFKGRDETKSFLEKASSILAQDGTIIVLGNSTNPWSKFESLNRHYRNLVALELLADEFVFELEQIDDAHPYRANHQFYITDFSAPTFPNQLIKIQRAA